MLARPPEVWHPSPAFLYADLAGPLLDIGPYGVATAVELVGPVRRVSALASRPREHATTPGRGGEFPIAEPTRVAAVLEHDGGVLTTLAASFDTDGAARHGIEVSGSDGTLLGGDPNTFDGPVILRRRGAETSRSRSSPSGGTTPAGSGCRTSATRCATTGRSARAARSACTSSRCCSRSGIGGHRRGGRPCRELAAEQAHLDRTYAAYDALLDALSVSRRDRHGDDVHRGGARADAARAPARVHERQRAAVLRADRPRGRRAAVRRAPRGRRPPTATCWRSTGARPRPSRSTPRRPSDPRGAHAPAAARHRGAHGARVRRRAARRGRRRPPDRGDRRGHHAPARGRDAADHLDDHARAVRADHASRPRARWSSRAVPARARPRSACTGRRGCCTPTRSSRARACSSSGPNRVFIAYISQVLPSLGEQSVEQRPIDALVSGRPWASGESEELATLLGSGRMAALLSRLLWEKVVLPEETTAMVVGRVAVEADARATSRSSIAEARARRTYQAGRERFRDRLADRLVDAGDGAGARRGSPPIPAAVASAVRQTQGVPAARQQGVAAADARGAGRGAVQEPQAPAARWPATCWRPRRSTCSLASRRRRRARR